MWLLLTGQVLVGELRNIDVYADHIEQPSPPVTSLVHPRIAFRGREERREGHHGRAITTYLHLKDNGHYALVGVMLKGIMQDASEGI